MLAGIAKYSAFEGDEAFASAAFDGRKQRVGVGNRVLPLQAAGKLVDAAEQLHKDTAAVDDSTECAAILGGRQALLDSEGPVGAYAHHVLLLCAQRQGQEQGALGVCSHCVRLLYVYLYSVHVAHVVVYTRGVSRHESVCSWGALHVPVHVAQAEQSLVHRLCTHGQRRVALCPPLRHGCCRSPELVGTRQHKDICHVLQLVAQHRRPLVDQACYGRFAEHGAPVALLHPAVLGQHRPHRRVGGGVCPRRQGELSDYGHGLGFAPRAVADAVQVDAKEALLVRRRECLRRVGVGAGNGLRPEDLGHEAVSIVANLLPLHCHARADAHVGVRLRVLVLGDVNHGETHDQRAQPRRVVQCSVVGHIDSEQGTPLVHPQHKKQTALPAYVLATQHTRPWLRGGAAGALRREAFCELRVDLGPLLAPDAKVSGKMVRQRVGLCVDEHAAVETLTAGILLLAARNRVLQWQHRHLDVLVHVPYAARPRAPLVVQVVGRLPRRPQHV